MEFFTCECGDKFVTSAQLTAHRREKHPGEGGNRTALEATLSELEREKRLGPIDAAYLQMLRGLADQLDSDPSNANMWRIYKDALESLTDDNDDGADAFSQLIQEINSRAAVGDPKKD